MIVFIVGLRRSGTTVFWRNFRQDQRFTCLDEPFNPLHHKIPEPHFKNTRTELIDIYKQNPAQFKSLFAPIRPLEELSPKFSEAQQKYINYLLKKRDTTHFVLDLTRCHFKLKALHRLFPSSYLIHLHKSPASFASSHLLPSYRHYPAASRKLKQLVDRFFFFNRRFNFNRWKMEEIIGRDENGPFPRQKIKDSAYRKAFGQAPAVSKLMAFWNYQFRQVEQVGAKVFGVRFQSLSLEEFCKSPEQTTKSLYRWLDIPYKSLNYEHVTFPSKPYKPRDSRWQKRAREINLESSRSFLFRY